MSSSSETQSSNEELLEEQENCEISENEESKFCLQMHSGIDKT